MKRALFFLFAVVFLYGETPYRLSICAIFQDEAPYLKEWIEFHRLVGVDHFFLYNHESKDAFRELLAPYIAQGIVDLEEVKEAAPDIAHFNPLQCRCYNECLAKNRGRSHWLAFIDIDEFLIPMCAETLPEVLKEFEGVGGVAVNWRIFGTSSVKKLDPSKLLIESLTRCSKTAYPLNRHIKTILRPERASHFINPHDCLYLEGYGQVNTDKIPFTNRFCPYFRSNKLRINHYWTRDEEYFFSKKLPRQKRWGGDVSRPDLLLEEMNVEEVREILRFVPALRARLRL